MTHAPNHEHTELVRRLEENRFIFAQNPKTITDAIKTDTGTPLDKILTRAYRIDSNGKIASTLTQSKKLIKGSSQLLSMGCFLLGFVGVFGLLGSQVVNFFYVVLAVLGWHTLSMLWWLYSLFRRDDESFFMVVYEQLTLKKPLLYQLINPDNPTVLEHAFALQSDIHRPIKRWYIGKIIHQAWLSSLFGTLVALLCLFLFRRYDFIWESTLLTDIHFAKFMNLFGALPTVFGFDLPSADMPKSEQNARFAWLTMLCIVLYGILPRLMGYVVCVVKSATYFTIDIKSYYYTNLIRQFSQHIIDQDDHRPDTLSSQPIIDVHDKSFILATLKYPMNDAINTTGPVNICHEFGVINDKNSLMLAINTAKQANAFIYLIIDVHILPDRGMVRRIMALAQTGLVVRLAGIDDAQNSHHHTWQQKLKELGVMMVE